MYPRRTVPRSRRGMGGHTTLRAASWTGSVADRLSRSQIPCFFTMTMPVWMVSPGNRRSSNRDAPILSCRSDNFYAHPSPRCSAARLLPRVLRHSGRWDPAPVSSLPDRQSSLTANHTKNRRIRGLRTSKCQRTSSYWSCCNVLVWAKMQGCLRRGPRWN